MAVDTIVTKLNISLTPLPLCPIQLGNIMISTIASSQASLLHPLSPFGPSSFDYANPEYLPNRVFCCYVDWLPPQLGPHCWLVALNSYLFAFSAVAIQTSSVPYYPVYCPSQLTVPPVMGSLSFLSTHLIIFYCHPHFSIFLQHKISKYTQVSLPTFWSRFSVPNPPTSSKLIPSRKHPSL